MVTSCVLDQLIYPRLMVEAQKGGSNWCYQCTYICSNRVILEDYPLKHRKRHKERLEN